MRQSLVLAALFLALVVGVAAAETLAHRQPVKVASAPLAAGPAASVAGASAGMSAPGPATEAPAPRRDVTALPTPTTVSTAVPAAPAVASAKDATIVPAAPTAVATAMAVAPTGTAQPRLPSPVPTAAPEMARAGAGQVTSRGTAGGYRVGLQVGHWRREEAGPPFNRQSGSSGGGKNEDEVNLAIARAAAEILEDFGYVVDVLPVVIPKGYTADLVVAVHADGGPASRRGFFVDRPVKSSVASDETRLARILDEEYGRTTGIPYVYRGTENSQYYYGYYAVNPRTPMVLIETGFLSNATDRLIIVDHPEVAAAGIARAIRRFVEGD